VWWSNDVALESEPIVNEFLPSPLYRALHALHFVVAAAWVAAASVADTHISHAVESPNPGDRRRAFGLARRVTLIFEMSAAGALLFLGILLAFINLAVFKQPWFHAKLLFVVLLFTLLAFTSITQKKIGRSLGDAQAGQLGGAYSTYRRLRAAMIGVGVALVTTVVLRF
jgi:uncharacterized membrane protein